MLPSNKFFTLIFVVGFLQFFSIGCAKIYYSPTAKKIAASHEVIAVIPSKVSIAATKKIDGDALKQQQKTESLAFQEEIYTWLLQRKMEQGFSFEILDVTTTNAILRSAGYFEDTPLRPSELCSILEVDAIFTSSFNLNKPMTEGGAVALALFTGFYGTTNEVAANVGIYDSANNIHIYNYSHKISGSTGSTTARLVDNLMKKASKKSPYNL